MNSSYSPSIIRRPQTPRETPVDRTGPFRVLSRETLPLTLSPGDGIWDLHPDEERFLTVRIRGQGDRGSPVYLVTNLHRRIRDVFPPER